VSDTDAEVARFREQISELDGVIIDAVNRRLALVTELKRYKDANGIAFVDPERERSMIDARVAANDGPLSDEGLRAFYLELLALTKRELER
jgi:chorismate mutase/prephenate dehydratase